MEYAILALAFQKWGKGKTIEEALKNGKIGKRDYCRVYFCTDPDSRIDDMGNPVVKAGSKMPFIIGTFNKRK